MITVEKRKSGREDVVYLKKVVLSQHVSLRLSDCQPVCVWLSVCTHVGCNTYGVSRLCWWAVCLPVGGGAEECVTSACLRLVFICKVTVTRSQSVCFNVINVPQLLSFYNSCPYYQYLHAISSHDEWGNLIFFTADVSGVDWMVRHGRSLALAIAVKAAPEKLCGKDYCDTVTETILTNATADRVRRVCVALCSSDNISLISPMSWYMGNTVGTFSRCGSIGSYL